MLETQVTTLEMSKKLAEAGFEAETPFWWVEFWREPKYRLRIASHRDDYVFDGSSKPAYTFQQLWECLPRRLVIDGEIYIPHTIAQGVVFSHFTDHKVYNDGSFFAFKRHLTDAVAQAILWTIKRGYLNVKTSLS